MPVQQVFLPHSSKYQRLTVDTSLQMSVVGPKLFRFFQTCFTEECEHTDFIWEVT